MTTHKKSNGEAGPEGAAQSAPDAAQAAEGVAEAAGAERRAAAAETGAPAAASEPAAAEAARLAAEVADLKDRLLRAHAEMDNVRKRLEREKADASKFAITKFARDVVGIGDNVQRAIDAVPHRLAEQEPALKSFVEGVTMIERELIAVLGRHGIKRIDPKGEPFNPHQHQAVVEMPSPDVPAGAVAQVFQHGYTIEERVLRPAMVAVSKGSPRPAPPAEVAAAGAGAGEGAGEAAARAEPKADNDPGEGPASGDPFQRG